MCYGLRRRVLEVFGPAAGTTDVKEVELSLRLADGSWLFIFRHELGHGVVNLYDLPVLELEEQRPATN